MKKASSTLALLLCATLSLTTPASADVITFDADGPAAENAAQQISGFDFAPGNALADNIGPLASVMPGNTFQLSNK